MKKRIFCVLTCLLCLSTTACETTHNTTIDTTESTSISETTTHPLIFENSGQIMIYYDRFHECIKNVVYLDTENWKDYLDVITYTEQQSIKDAFGEIISTEKIDHAVLGVKTDMYHRCEDVLIELQHIQTNEKTIIRIGDCNDNIPNNFDLNAYECTRIKGRIYFVDLPEEVILLPDLKWGYDCAFTIGNISLQMPYEINQYTKEIYHNGSENWEEKYMK